MAAPDIQFQVINLERRPDRRQRFLLWNEHTPGMRFEFFQAVDGELLDLDVLRQSALVAERANFHPGQLACALSHREILLQARTASRTTFICEDDAILRLDFVAQWHILHAQLPVHWDMVLFGYNFDAAVTMELIPGVQSFLSSFDNRPMDDHALNRFQRCLQPVLAPRLVNAFGTAAYAVSPAGAAKLLEAVFPLRNEEVPIPCLRKVLRAFSIDCLLNRYYRSWQAYAAFPPLAVTPNDKSQSDTGG